MCLYNPHEICACIYSTLGTQNFQELESSDGKKRLRLDDKEDDHDNDNVTEEGGGGGRVVMVGVGVVLLRSRRSDSSRVRVAAGGGAGGGGVVRGETAGDDGSGRVCHRQSGGAS